jgi:hypothetical protein
MLGNVINHFNLSQKQKVTESFNILENKSGVPEQVDKIYQQGRAKITN